MNELAEQKSTPRDVFLHLLNIVTFYISVISFTTLWLQYVNVFYPDPLNFYYAGILDSILWATSILVIAFPFYLFTSWLLERDFKRNPEKRELKVRKWLLYFTLFVSAVTILVDLITLVYNFLRGELTLPFFFKTLVVLIVAAIVFRYYFWDLKRRAQSVSRIPFYAAVGTLAIVLASIVAGFILVGTPAAQRARRFDEQRINDLSLIQTQALNYWIQKDTLPARTEDLEDSLAGVQIPRDPETGTSYEYRVVGPLSFELCAAFDAPTDARFEGKGAITSPAPYRPEGSFPPQQSSWSHDKGRTCFTRTIDPELYKTMKPQPKP